MQAAEETAATVVTIVAILTLFALITVIIPQPATEPVGPAIAAAAQETSAKTVRARADAPIAARIVADWSTLVGGTTAIVAMILKQKTRR